MALSVYNHTVSVFLAIVIFNIMLFRAMVTAIQAARYAAGKYLFMSIFAIDAIAFGGSKSRCR